MSESRPYRGKDGNRYSDYYEMQAANTRYDQQQKLIEEQQKANKLINEQNQRIKNGGYTDNEIIGKNIKTGILGYIANKNYQSEISVNLMTLIFVMCMFIPLVCFFLAISGQANAIPIVIVVAIIIYIFFKTSIHFMEKSITNNKKDIKYEKNETLLEQKKDYKQDEIMIKLDEIKEDKIGTEEHQEEVYLKEPLDPLYAEIVKMGLKQDIISKKMIKNEFNIDDDRAKRIINQLEETGIIHKTSDETKKIAINKDFINQVDSYVDYWNSSYKSK